MNLANNQDTKLLHKDRLSFSLLAINHVKMPKQQKHQILKGNALIKVKVYHSEKQLQNLLKVNLKDLKFWRVVYTMFINWNTKH